MAVVITTDMDLEKRQKFYSMINRMGCTGTAAYKLPGVVPADEDRYCTPLQLDELKSLLDELGYTAQRSCYCGGIAFYFDNRLYNIIPVPEQSLNAMRIVTEFVTKLGTEGEEYVRWLSTKKNRYMLFRSLLAIVETIDSE